MILFRLFRCPVIIVAASPSLLLFIQHPLQSQKHALRIYFHIYMYARGGKVEHRGRSSRVCKFFSKNSLRDNGFSMSHTSLPTSLLTSLPRHTQHNSSNLHSIPLPSLRTPATITSIPPSPTPPVALCFWGMIDGKSQ